MNRDLELVALVVTVLVAGSLLVLAQPATAVDITVDGPSEVTPDERASFDAVVDTRSDPVDVDSLNVVIMTDTGESVTVTFAPDGTVLDVRSSGVTKETINIKQLETSLDIALESERDDVGYGVNGGDALAYQIQFDGKAFADGEFDLSVSINTPDEQNRDSSAEETFVISSAETST
ncbi:hypothetical protein [Natrinema salsiterrestre]|uniref:Uncharacterized protein n=1 Tax=Natrinema salsiterrestre TaxID=2950540 RepID=A0A9Q4L361_9EURY|nr:hypothetical protein [Natrinema salsiterrestre]MDF9746754.1 hypothetical protein [Natrinema salsiterrestre]